MISESKKTHKDFVSQCQSIEQSPIRFVVRIQISSFSLPVCMILGQTSHKMFFWFVFEGGLKRRMLLYVEGYISQIGNSN